MMAQFLSTRPLAFANRGLPGQTGSTNRRCRCPATSPARRATRAANRQAATWRPALVIEIVSPSTRKRDEQLKRRLYERTAVHEDWLVNPDAARSSSGGRRWLLPAGGRSYCPGTRHADDPARAGMVTGARALVPLSAGLVAWAPAQRPPGSTPEERFAYNPLDREGLCDQPRVSCSCV